MRLYRRICAFAVVATASVAALGGRSDAQSPSPADEHARHILPANSAPAPRATAMIDAARKASDLYADRRAAIAAGYRRVGRDFPSMGEHWLNPRLIIEGTFDPSHPSVLAYAVIEDKPVLLGVVYAIPLAPGESPPGDFGVDARWHEHNGTLDEEAFLASHSMPAEVTTGTRIAVLHLWVRVPAPDGVFVAENWALPFVRLGLAVPSRFPNSSSRALSMMSGGTEFFADMAGTSARGKAVQLLAECQARAQSIVGAARIAGRELTDGDLSELDMAWRKAMANLAKTDPEAAVRLNGGILANSR